MGPPGTCRAHSPDVRMTAQRPLIPDNVELHCLSNFTFLRGASRPEELVERARELGYAALAITDECSMAGVVRAHVWAKDAKLKLIIGSQFLVRCDSPFTLVVLACNLAGYGNLCEFITRLRRAAPKGTYHLSIDDIQAAALADCVVIACPERSASPEQLLTLARWLLTHFTGRCWLGVQLLRQIDDEVLLHRLRQTHELSAIPLVACGDVHMHVRSRKPLQDVLSATRVSRPLTECGFELQLNAERHLRSRLRLAQTYSPELLAETIAIADRCDFSLEELSYQYPAEVVPADETPTSYPATDLPRCGPALAARHLGRDPGPDRA